MKKVIHFIFILSILCLFSGCITGAHIGSGGSFGMSIGSTIF